MGEAAGDLAGVGQAAPGRHPAVAGRRIRAEGDVGGQFRRGPVVDTQALGPVAAEQRLPGIDGGFVDEPVDAPGTGQ
ncbi:hypothetical protein [Streptomyces sp. NPDC002559]